MNVYRQFHLQRLVEYSMSIKLTLLLVVYMYINFHTRITVLVSRAYTNITTFTNWEQIYHLHETCDYHISYYIITYFMCTLDCAFKNIKGKCVFLSQFAMQNRKLRRKSSRISSPPVHYRIKDLPRVTCIIFLQNLTRISNLAILFTYLNRPVCQQTIKRKCVQQNSMHYVHKAPLNTCIPKFSKYTTI